MTAVNGKANYDTELKQYGFPVDIQKLTDLHNNGVSHLHGRYPM